MNARSFILPAAYLEIATALCLRGLGTAEIVAHFDNEDEWNEGINPGDGARRFARAAQEVLGARFNQHFERLPGYDHKLVWALDHRMYRNTCALGASHARSLNGDWQVRARLDLQHTNEVLVGPEQFGIGGANSVRGFLERERADDRGHAAAVEIHTPELSARLGSKGWNLRLLAFYDLGRTSRVSPQPGEPVHSGSASAGVGVRLSRQKDFNLRFDLANIRDPGGTRERNHWRFHFASVITF